MTHFSVLCMALAGLLSGPASAMNGLDFLYGEEPASASQRLSPMQASLATSTVLRAADWQQHGWQTLEDVLRTVPGMQLRFLKDFPVERVLVVRGQGSRTERVLLLLDGMPLNNPFNGGWNHAMLNMPLQGLQRIEVVRGPGRAEYGDHAMSAVIRLISADPVNDAETLALAAGNEGRRSVAVHTAHASGASRWQLSATRRQSDVAYAIAADADGRAGVSVDHQRGTGLHGSWHRGDWRASALWQAQRHGLPLSADNRIDSASRYYTRQMAFSLRHVIPLASGHLHSRLGGNRLLFDPDWQMGPPASMEILRTRLGNQVWHAALDWQGVRGRHHWQLGTARQWQQQFDVRSWLNGREISATANHNRARQRQISSLFVEDEWNLTRLASLTLGLRGDRYSARHTVWNPRLAWVWLLRPELSLTGIYGSAFRLPSFLESSQKNSRVVQGNPNLKAERLRNLEGIAAWQINDDWSLRSTLFYNRVQNRIGGTPVLRNEGGSSVYGSELELTAVWPGQKLWASISRLHSRDWHSGRRLADGPAAMLRAGWLQRWRHWHDLRTELTFRWQGITTREAGDVRPVLPARGVWDFGLHGHSWSVQINNLWDKRLENPSNPVLPNGVPEPESQRSWWLRWQYEG